MGDPPVGEAAPPVVAQAALRPIARRRDPRPVSVRVHYRTYRHLEQLHVALNSLFSGFALAALTEQRRYALDREYYNRERMYHAPEYNQRGLFDWERAVLEQYFTHRTPLLLPCAGGGREVIALRRMGFSVHAFECHAELAAAANSLLRRLGLEPDVQVSPRDHCPQVRASCAGAIVGWGGYTLIRGRARRVAFLREIRAQLVEGSPLLVSYMCRHPGARHFHGVAYLANSMRFALGGDRAEVGDYCVPNFVHFFSMEEVREELADAGFDMIWSSTTPYGHAVAHAGR